jgi:branched-chain amino acid transport system substrate-binding protein
MSLIFVAALLAAGCAEKPGGTSATANQKNAKEYTVGASNCITGRGAAVAAEMSKGFTLGSEVANQAHPDFKLVPVIEDNQAIAEVGVRVFEKLSSDGVPVVTTCGGPSVAATTPIAERSKVVIMNPSGQPMDSQWVLNVYPTFNDEGRAMARYMYEKGHRRVATYISSYEYGFGTRKAFSEEFTKLGGQIVENLEVDPNSTDHQGAITKLKAIRPPPDALWVVSTGSPAGSLVKQKGQAGFDVPLYGTGGFASQSVLEIGEKYAEGVTFTQAAWDLKSNDPATQTFVQAYKAKYGDPAAANPYLIAFFNSVLIVDRGVQELRKEGKEYNGQNLLDALYSIGSFPVVGGSTIKFARGQDVELPTGVAQVRDGKFVYVKTMA